MVYITKNHCFHIEDVRDITLDRCENKIYVAFRCGDTRDMVMRYDTTEGALKDFTEICLAMQKEERV